MFKGNNCCSVETCEDYAALFQTSHSMFHVKMLKNRLSVDCASQAIFYTQVHVNFSGWDHVFLGLFWIYNA